MKVLRWFFVPAAVPIGYLGGMLATLALYLLNKLFYLLSQASPSPRGEPLNPDSVGWAYMAIASALAGALMTFTAGRIAPTRRAVAAGAIGGAWTLWVAWRGISVETGDAARSMLMLVATAAGAAGGTYLTARVATEEGTFTNGGGGT